MIQKGVPCRTYGKINQGKTGEDLYRAYFVDDEPHALNTLTGNPLFYDSGYQTVGSSTNPIKALDEIKRLNPDVVFTDLKMPKLTGIELMEQLRDKGARCEFVIISAYGEFDAARSFYNMKGFDYLTKPVSDKNLLILLEKLSGRLAGNKAEPSVTANTPSPELDKMIAYMRENLTEKHTLDSLSEKFDTNYTYICDLFSTHLGTTFVSYLTKLRMDAAAEYLKDKNKSVKEIAALCGYDYLYFIQVFKKYHACTPTAYREGRR